MNKENGYFKTTCLAAIIGLLYNGSLVAQQIDEQDDYTIEKIEVTAQKRIQSIQEVPIALTAFSGKQLEESGVVSFQDLEGVDPSLTIRSSTDESRGSALRIRGVGTTGNNTGLESSVGVFIDGVYLSRAGMAMNDLMDIERVEVLRGPQGTLFGKNTTSGALSISTKLPDFENDLQLGLTYGSDNDQKINGAVGGGIIEDKVAGRLTFTHHTRDGLVEDVNTGKTFNNIDRWSTRGQLLIEPQDDISLRIIGDYSEKEENCCASPYLLFGPRQEMIETLGGTRVSENPFDRQVAINGEHYNFAKDYGLSGELKWDFDNLYLTVISSFRNYSYDLLADSDRTDLDISNVAVTSEVEAITNEFRVQGSKGSLNWMLGAYFFSEDISEQSSTLYGADTGLFVSNLAALPEATKALVASTYIDGQGATLNDFYQKTDGWAIFTHNDINLSDEFTLTAGLRYNSESKKGGGDFLSESTSLCGHPQLGALGLICPVDNFNSDMDYEEITGTLKVSYELNNDAMLFGGYSRGFKAGGINLSRDAAQSDFEFSPETVDTWEIGLKSELLNNLVRLNVSTYYSEFNDYQLNTYDGTGFVISNAAGVKSQGFEVDVTTVLSQNMLLKAGYGYNDSVYTKDTIDNNLAGKQLSNAPKDTVTLALLYTKDVYENAEIFGNVNTRYQSGINTGSDLDPAKFQSAYTIMNARIGLRDLDEKWEVALWAKNILDEEYLVVVIDTPVQAGSLSSYVGQSASYGISTTFRF